MLATAGTVAMCAITPAMAQEYYLGQLIEVGNNFCPAGWIETNGQLLAINTNTALFSLLGTTYGGNGQTTFALPDLRGRMLIGQGQGPGLPSYVIGQTGGVESQTLTLNQLASHSHEALILSVGTQTANSRTAFRNAISTTPNPQYSTTIQFDGALHPDSLHMQNTGGSDAVPNMSPFLVNRYCIARQGIFPSRN
ncbi:MAG TPA: tail fiber protein [Sphingopyxis sp.]|nr:tail fiber protein [Sphingopyxis sp.]HMQ18388.1 tail fiber protein [Sphingopyxis sp.]